MSLYDAYKEWWVREEYATRDSPEADGVRTLFQGHSQHGFTHYG
jgi:hypothetical protein